MSKISTYEVVPIPKLSDKLIGTSVGGEIEDVTYNFTLQELLDLFIPNIPANNLQGVLNYGNTATQDINLFGTITTTNLDVTDTATLFKTYLNEEVHVVGKLFDSLDAVGTPGQFLISTGAGVEWYTVPVFIPTLQQVLTEGDTADVDIILDANIEALDISVDTAHVADNLYVLGKLTDGFSSFGSNGQVLSSTSTGVKWVDLPTYSALSPLLFNSISGVFSIQQANGVQSGYLSYADWINFDGKQNAGNYITALTGEATASGPGSVPITLNNAAVISKVLSGLNIMGGSIVATDSILTAFGKVQNQINGLLGGVVYQGTWDASSNTPTLVSSVGVQGHYYVVNVAGSVNLNGITSWQVGDWAIFNGGTWQKVDNTDAVISVNGFTGIVSLITDNIPEGLTNLYFTNGRARNALSATSPLIYDNFSGNFTIQQGNASQDGYISSLDWITFNSKQNALSGTGLVKSTGGSITYITDNSSNWNTAYNDSIISAAVTGAATKTLTLTQQDGGTVVATWTESPSGLTSVGLSMPPAFTVSNSPLTSNGTIAVLGAGIPSQYIRGDGTLANFPSNGGGGGASVSYYLNGGVNQGVFGGDTYYEMNRTPVLVPGVDFSISTDGYITQFITDAGDPALLNIPAGNWLFELFLSASSSGGSPSFYVELYKYDGVVFTLIADNSINSEQITGGTNIDFYTTALAVPQTSLTLTDRLAVRVYVITSGRIITLHTQGPHLSEVTTTFSTGLLTLNGLSTQVQYFATGTAGTDFNILSTGSTHTFNIPTASVTNRGLLSSTDWSTFNSKQDALTLTTIGSSGAATLIGSTLNIPQYSGTNIYNSDGTISSTRTVTVSGALNFVRTVNGVVATFINNDDNYNAAVAIQNNSTSSTSLTALQFNDRNGLVRANFGYYPDTFFNVPLRNALYFANVYEGIIFTANSGAVGGVGKDIIFQTIGTPAVDQMRIFGSTGNVAINSNTDAGFKLDVNGTSMLRGTIFQNQSIAIAPALMSKTFSNSTSVIIGTQSVAGQINDANILIGFDAGRNLGSTNTAEAAMNIIIGREAAIASLTTGVKNILIGTYQGSSLWFPLASNASYKLLIGNINAGGGGTLISGDMLQGSMWVNPTVTNSNTPDASVAFGINSTIVGVGSSTAHKGFLPPRVTNAQRTAIGTPAVGLQVYATDATEGQFVNLSTGWFRFLTTADIGTVITSTNIYNSDGSLTGARALTLSGNALDIIGTTTTRFFANGRVGVGTTTDGGFQLDVNGTLRSSTLTATSTGNSINIPSGGRIFYGNREVSIGELVTAGYEAVGIGWNISAPNSGNILIGKNLNASTFGNVIMLSTSNSVITATSNSTLNIGSVNTSGVAIFGSTSGSSSSTEIAIYGSATGAGVEGNIAIGRDASATGSYAIALGAYAIAATSEFVAGSRGKPVSNVYFGSGNQSSLSGGNGSGSSYTINGSAALGTDFAGGNITIAGGRGTGAGVSGSVIFSTASTTTSGTTLQTLTERVRIFGTTGNVLIQNGGTFTDAGFRLDVNGTGRFSSNLSFSGGSFVSSSIYYSAQYGLVFGGGTGSSSDATLTDRSGNLRFQIVNGGNIIQTASVISSIGIGVNAAASLSISASYGLIYRGITATIFNASFLENTGNDGLFIDSVGNIKIGRFNSTYNSSAILDVVSTTKGFLPPRMTAAQRTAIGTPAVGLVVYQTDGTEGLYENTSTGWRLINAAGGGGSGTVTSVSVVSANGFAGTVANPSTTPAITISTTISGLLIGNGTSIAAAVDGTDYFSPSSLDGVGNIQFYSNPSGTKSVVFGGLYTIINLDSTSSPYTISHPTGINPTLVATEMHIYSCDATSGNIIINLDALGVAGTWPDKRMIIIKKTDTSANTVTVSASSPDTIDGGGSAVLVGQSSITIYPNLLNNSWIII